MNTVKLRQLYAARFGEEAASIRPIAAAGSARQYYRMSSADGQTVIGTVGNDVEENDAFCYLTRHFTAHKLPVPRLIAVSSDRRCYLQTDAGSLSLFDAITDGRNKGGEYSPEEVQMVERVVRLLPAMQFRAVADLDWNRCYPQPEMDERNVMFDLNYFKYCFLKPSGTTFNELRLEEAFHRFASQLLSDDGDKCFILRDCQARNVMLNADLEPCFIDYQGGRRGAFYYDLASLLWQSSARYPEPMRQRLINAYREAATEEHVLMPDEEQLHSRLKLFVLFRTLQVLGAYGYRGLFERKAHFIASISPALENLKGLLPEFARRHPYLCSVLGEMIEQRENDIATSLPVPREGRLTVTIWSFSYKHGLPDDTSGNGGGYVFDCRSTHNPGRHDQYRNLTGLDRQVMDFLEHDGEITSFLDSVCRLADFHVRRYLERSFTSLMFAFGCTGGQHRSVYSAQHLAEHLHRTFPVDIRLIHREQHITRHLLAQEEKK